HGTRVEVKVVEKVLPPAKESQKPADIVARCEGLVDQVLVMTGEAVVKSGDMVKPGQKLISGMIQTPEGPGGVNNQVTEDGEIIPLLPRQVSARGIVRARTWHQGYGEVTVTESGYKPSGVIVTRTSIKWRKGEIIIKGPKSSPFQHSRQVVTRKKAPSWRNYIIPVEIVNTEFHEMIPFTINRGVEAARQLAREKAVNQLKQQVSPQAEVLKEQVEETSDPTDNLIQLRITWETMEDIGIVKYWPESN
ncbi:MAG TPA: sporulation protein YqfD, partial [Bacillota bacterium]|nr:sporulation protein YqfD [Bacillota bacterium]